MNEGCRSALYISTQRFCRVRPKPRMTGHHIKPTALRHMDIFTAKSVHVMIFLALLAHLTRDAGGVATCCTRQPRPCRLYELLCRAGHVNATEAAGKTGRLTDDAAAGILTLGKRKATESRYQDRLQHLLHGARNQAAGILTMGRRNEEEGGALALAPPRAADSAPARLEPERAIKYLMQPVDRDSYRR